LPGASTRSSRILILILSNGILFAPLASAQKFATPVAYTTGALALNGVAVGDLNGDGHLDVVVANEDNPGTIAVLLGNGDGTLRAPVTYGPFTDAFSLAIGGFNRDRALDIAVADTASGSLLLGKGDGTFTSGSPIGATNATWFAVADFNRDHKLDLAATDNGGFALQILLGNGRGAFTLSSSYSVATPPISVVARDLNGDRIPDIAVSDEAVNNLDSNVTVFLSSGGGYVATRYPYGHEPRCIVFGTFNGRPDMVTANEFSGTVDLFANEDKGVFHPPLVFSIGALHCG
jgi:FG-GAP-like repeat